MNVEPLIASTGEELGHKSVEHVIEIVGNMARCERRRLSLACRADIMKWKARLFFLQRHIDALWERRRRTPPAGDLRTRRKRCHYYTTVAVILTLAGLFFALLAFDPFQLGWKAYVYCLAVAIVTPFAVDKVLDLWDSERLLKVLAATAACAALISLVLLALIRGELAPEAGDVEIQPGLRMAHVEQETPASTRPR